MNHRIVSVSVKDGTELREQSLYWKLYRGRSGWGVLWWHQRLVSLSPCTELYMKIWDERVKSEPWWAHEQERHIQGSGMALSGQWSPNQGDKETPSMGSWFTEVKSNLNMIRNALFLVMNVTIDKICVVTFIFNKINHFGFSFFPTWFLRNQWI